MKSFTITRRNGDQHVVMVSDEDYEEVMKHKWNVQKRNNTFYVKRHPSISLHRQLLRLTDPKLYGDHKDHNGLNNQRDNLRIADSQKNQFNRKSQKKSSSQYKGVSWSKRDEKWQVHISIDKKSRYIGYFVNEYDAHLAYEAKAKEIQGDFKYKK